MTAVGQRKRRGTFFRQWMNTEHSRLDYLVNWSPQHRFIYVETPKVACTTIKRILQRAEVQGEDDRLASNVHDRALSPLKKPSDDLEAFIRDLEDPHVLLFCFVRDPFTRTLSCYLDKIVSNAWERNRLGPKLDFRRGEKVSFERFLRAVATQEPIERDIHWMAQSDLLCPRQMQYDFIGRLENFADDFSLTLRTLGLDKLNEQGAERSNVTNAVEKLSSHYNKQTTKLVKEIYQKDFDELGYGRKTPQLIQKPSKINQ